MNRVTKLNPETCPKAIAAIINRWHDNFEAGDRGAADGYVVFQGLVYEITVNNEVWHVAPAYDGEPRENNWTDSSFRNL